MQLNKKPTEHHLGVTVNGNKVTKVLIGRHYLKKHSSYMSDALILDLVMALNGHSFPMDSSTDGIEYYVADIQMESNGKTFRIIWLFEGKSLEVLGVINAYRRSKKKE
jgi:hypothetical protein